jgi:hypothetical protein
VSSILTTPIWNKRIKGLKKKIIIEVDDKQTITLTDKQAKELYNFLHEMYGEKETPIVPMVPVETPQPVSPWVYQPYTTSGDTTTYRTYRVLIGDEEHFTNKSEETLTG